jgi:hypothetical protein
MRCMTKRSIRSRLLPTALAVVIAVLAGCASQATMTARYDQSLQRWKGAMRGDLVAAWGKPLQAQAEGGVETLTWTFNDDMPDHQAQPVPTTLPSGAILVNMPTAAPVVPMRCTTHFQLRDGIVTSWNFDGLACGAQS